MESLLLNLVLDRYLTQQLPMIKLQWIRIDVCDDVSFIEHGGKELIAISGVRRFSLFKRWKSPL